MNKDALSGALFLAPLFVLFAIFFAAIYFRGRYNRAHPEAGRTPAQRLRGKIIGWIAFVLVLCGCAYGLLQENRFAPSWAATFFVGAVAFVLGEGLGRWNALRQLDGKSKPEEQAVTF